MYGENDATRVVTIRISEKEYKQLKELVDHDRYTYPKPTISNKARRMIQYCLRECPERFKVRIL